MLCDWQLPISTGSLLNIISTESFLFFAGKMLLRQVSASAAITPTAAAVNPLIVRPPRETLVKSGENFSWICTGLVLAFRLGNQCNGHTDATIHNRLSRDLHRISLSTF